MFNIIREDDLFIKDIGIEGKFVFHVKGGFEVNTKSQTEACKKVFSEYAASLQKSNERFGKDALSLQIVGAGLNSLYFEIDSDLEGIDANHPELAAFLPNWDGFLTKLIKASPKISLKFEVYAGVYRVSGELKPWQIIRYIEGGQKPLFFTYVPMMGPEEPGGDWEYAKPAFEEGVYMYHKASQTDACIVETMDEESYRKAYNGYSPYKKYWKKPRDRYFKYTSGFSDHGSIEFKERPYLTSHCFTGQLPEEFGLGHISFWADGTPLAKGAENQSDSLETLPWFVYDPENGGTFYYYANWKRIKKNDFLSAISQDDKQAFEAAASMFAEQISRFFREGVCARLPSFIALSCVEFVKKYASKGIYPPCLSECKAMAECETLTIEEDPDPHAYFLNPYIKTLIIGKNVHSIPDLSFAGCLNLREIKGGEALERIGDGAFAKCVSLESFGFPGQSSIKSMGRNAFLGCKALKSFVVPSQKVLASCKGLEVESLYFADEFELDEGTRELKLTVSAKEIHFPKAFIQSHRKVDALSLVIMGTEKTDVFVNHSDEKLHLSGPIGSIHIGPTVSFVICRYSESIDLDETNPYLKIVDNEVYSRDEAYPSPFVRPRK